MGKTVTPAKDTKSTATTRVQRTPEQRIADLEAQLQAARDKATARQNKGRDEAHAKRAKLVERIAGLQTQVDAIDAEFPPVEDETPEGDES